eukprot:gnl/TRDRNA2_/TRDRNA2_84995_c0_seq1.p1 gnl/TRDRNA2_/TRDRNA2_84995_c0~~gnl/TRDRNA2_/TRDRNA2_84995_c0_seq1.p1  ORF type:complete len:443 (+),score=54.06 gnl/TRDRNA2_/TRDRNA2_84995_c0_seq1:65-1393(+)
MPQPSKLQRPSSWLSLARASLRWAEVCSCTRTERRPGRDRESCHKGARGIGAGGLVGRGAGGSGPSEAKTTRMRWPSRAPLGGDSCLAFKLETLCVAGRSDAPELLATGHDQAVRLWRLPELERLCMLNTRGAVQALDLGIGGRFLAAACLLRGSGGGSAPGAALATLWDLTGDLKKPLWEASVPSVARVVFCSGASGLLLVVDAEGCSLFDVQIGTKCYAVGIPGCSPKAGCCQPAVLSSTVLIGGDRGVWTVGVEAKQAQCSAACTYEVPACGTGSRSSCIIAVATAHNDLAAATDSGYLIVWHVADRALLACLDMRSESLAESLSWAVDRADGLSAAPCTTALLAIDEAVICVMEVNSGAARACALGAWHTHTGTRLPNPWHRATPLDGPSAAPAVVLMPAGSVVRVLAADPSLHWVVVAFTEASGAPCTVIAGRGRCA